MYNYDDYDYYDDEEENYDDDYYYEDNDDYYYDDGYGNNYYDYEYYDNYDDYDHYYDDDYNYNKYNSYKQKSIEDQYRFDNKSCFTEIVDKKIDPNPYNEIKDNSVKVLMIAEKPSIAKTIAKILSTKKSLNDFSKKNGWCLYNFNGIFKGKNANFTVSSVAGHLYETEFLRMHQDRN